MSRHIQLVISLLLISTCSHEKVLGEHNHITREKLYNSDPKGIEHCSTSDLDHSVLVECTGSDCDETKNQGTTWPKIRSEIIHVYSSRSGDRFAVNSLPNLDFQENELERTLNINTTYYVNSTQRSHEILGFGTFLDPTLGFVSREEFENMFHQVYEQIFRDLYGKFQSNNQFTILSIPIARDSIIERKVYQNLLQIDSLATKVLGSENHEYSKIKVILNFEHLDRTLEMIEPLKETAKVMSEFRVLEIWAVTVDQDWLLENSSNESILEFLQELFSTKNTFARTNITLVPNFVDTITNSRSILRGLVIKSQYSSVYNTLEYVKGSRKDLIVITVGRDKLQITEYGDWSTAQDYAVEILNHLRYGSNAFVEASSTVDILKEPYSRDCSIYSLRQGHDVHFRGPMFYAIGHFSRYVVPGSRLLKSNVFTQPNMFAANYISFITPQNYIISIILNDNEHLLPFRLAVDGHIMAYSNLQPKSFNTIIIKQ